jgi:hypothetical protein
MIRFSLLCCTGQIVRGVENGKVQFAVLYRTVCERFSLLCCTGQIVRSVENAKVQFAVSHRTDFERC